MAGNDDDRGHLRSNPVGDYVPERANCTGTHEGSNQKIFCRNDFITVFVYGFSAAFLFHRVFVRYNDVALFLHGAAQ